MDNNTSTSCYLCYGRYMKSSRRGFTLIELLVVVSIVGLLSSVVITSVDSARIKARDSQRKTQVASFVKALEIYRTTTGRYPCATATCDNTAVTAFTQTSVAGQALIARKAILSIPSDPFYSDTVSCNSNGGGYCYCSRDGLGYVLSVNTEDDKGGSVRCLYREGETANLCTAHQSPGIYAVDLCVDRF